MQNRIEKIAGPLLVPKKIVVTGGAGFIGSHIVDALVEKGYDVHVIDNLFSGNIAHVNKKAIFHKIDIRNKGSVIKAIKHATFVFHCASISSEEYCVKNKKESQAINVGGWIHVLEACRIAGVKKVVFSSSSAVYDIFNKSVLDEKTPLIPNTVYGFQKYLAEINAERWYQEYNVPVISLRYFKVYGERQRVGQSYTSFLPDFLLRRKNKENIVLYNDGGHERDFVHIHDVVAANLAVIDETSNIKFGSAINVASGEGVSPKEVVEILDAKSGIVYAEKNITKTHVACIELAKESLGWEPAITLQHGLLALGGI